MSTVKILIIGGGRFAGHHFTEAAANAGHQVTQFNRGQTSLPAPDGVERIIGDRDGEIAQLTGRTWDAVVDMCGYLPRVVRQSCEALENRTHRYLFISTISVYADNPGRIDESSPREILGDPDTETIDGDTYGGLKALCEDVVTDVYGERALIVRPGMIVGPLDPTDRLTWWIARAADGGRIPAIGSVDTPMQYIDARDQATWMLRALGDGSGGVVNVTGHPTTLRATLDAARPAHGEVVYVTPEDADARGVEPSKFAWNVPADRLSIWDVDVTRALAAGLELRAVGDTVRDTVAWHRSRGEHEWKAGLTPAEEALLLG
ncbi:MAG: NAD-dependent epimerase/dehydratase family protein [Armatimonadota bacterium]|nr:NAD-dependent epimerase/dehydratase family protein [Armatimonadota bacterium]